MKEYHNDILLRVVAGERAERTPVWIMRQAGRTLAEYKAVRKQAGSFKALVTNPDLAAEVTVQPIDIYQVDAAIIFSDILVIPEAMGLPYEMVEKRGPFFPNTIRSKTDIKKLKTYEEGDLEYVTKAIELTKKKLAGRVPLIGFAGAPWTIFCYMVEGAGSKTFSIARSLLYQEPDFAHELLQKITSSTIGYLKDQIKAGADLIQLFDSWAGVLPPLHYTEFSLKYIREIFDAIYEVPKTLFAKGAYFARRQFNSLNCDIIGLDWNMDIYESRELMNKKILQGNMDPCALYGDFKSIESNVKEMLDAFGPYNHIANLGHGVYPDIEREKVQFFVETVRQYSEKMPRPYPVRKGDWRR